MLKKNMKAYFLAIIIAITGPFGLNTMKINASETVEINGEPFIIHDYDNILNVISRPGGSVSLKQTRYFSAYIDGKDTKFPCFIEEIVYSRSGKEGGKYYNNFIKLKEKYGYDENFEKGMKDFGSAWQGYEISKGHIVGIFLPSGYFLFDEDFFPKDMKIRDGQFKSMDDFYDIFKEKAKKDKIVANAMKDGVYLTIEELR